MNRRLSPALVSLLLSGTLLISGCAAGADTTSATPPAGQTPAAATTRPVATAIPTQPVGSGGVRLSDGTVIANGRVLPEHAVDLSFEIDGVVAEILVKPGDQVTVGQALGHLDTRNLNLQIEEAKAQLAEAQANYEKLIAGATDPQIQRAEALVAEAKARLNVNRNGVTQQEIAVAKAELKEAQQALARLKAGPTTEEIAIYQAAVERTHARLQTRRATLAADKLRIESQVERAANDLRDRQDIYSRIYWENQAKRDADVTLTQDELDAEAQALRDVQNAEKYRDEIKLSLEEAKQHEVTEIRSYEADVQEAEARLNDLLIGALPDDITSAERMVLQAQVKLDNLNGPEQRYTGEALNAVLLQAEANLAALIADPQSSEITIAKARIARAEVTLKQADLAIDRVSIRSPINGTIAAVNVSIGQVAQSGEWAFTVANLRNWKIVTADLNELNISQIREGDPVLMTFFAIPGLELPGRVSYIETMGRTTDIGTSYDITIIPDSWDDRLRWNMSTQVLFLPEN